MAKPRTLQIFTTPADVALAFYQAFEARDIDAMMATWAEDEDIVCVHPGGTRMVGYDAVRVGSEQLFSSDTRLSFRLLRNWLVRRRPEATRRALIYGAGDGGELLFRELRNNAELQRVPVAFLDDDPRKAGRLLHGLTIATPDGAGSIAALCRAVAAEELLVSTAKLPPARMRAVVDECERAGVAVRQMNIDIRALTVSAPIFSTNPRGATPTTSG